jgi:hypothetical protein
VAGAAGAEEVVEVAEVEEAAVEEAAAAVRPARF